MKLILDLPNELVQEMQIYANKEKTTINELISSLFTEYIRKPRAHLKTFEMDEGGLNNFQQFTRVLTTYLNEATYNIESLIGTEEEDPDDEAMAEVFRALNRDFIKRADIITELYLVYYRKKHIKYD